jgi:peptidoglycan/LPS O-acetylase OafA/YrhL
LRTKLSILLDSLRIAAALAVYFSHCAQFWSRDAYKMLGPIAFGAVVTFFVLSGYVIAATTLSKSISPHRYIVSRLSRLYSAVLPALLLAAILELVGRRMNPGFYADFSRGHDVMRYAWASVFLQNVWWMSASPPTNPPMWSLCYEFWYYAIFGMAIFSKGGTIRKILSVLSVAFIAGPNVLLLMPCWLFGVLVYVAGSRSAAPPGRAYGYFILAVATFLFFILVVPEYPKPLGTPPYYFSAAFVSDWSLAAAVAFTIASCDSWLRSNLNETLVHGAAAKVVRNWADHTFPLYLYHFPVLVFLTATVPFDKNSTGQRLAMTGATLVVVLVLSWATESQRKRWKSLFEWLWHVARAPFVNETSAVLLDGDK